MTTDELDSGPETGARQHFGLWVALMVFGLAIGAWLLVEARSNDEGSSPSATASASVPAESPSASVEQRPGIADSELELGEVCTPETDGRVRLSVPFTLVNPSAADLVLMDVVPVTSPGDLELLSTRIVAGGCGGGGDPLASARIPAGESVRVTFRFALPANCPQPLSLSAEVFSRVFDVVRSGHRTRIPLYRDLGAIDFATCA